MASRLLSLPTELLDRIIEFAVIEDHPIEIRMNFLLSRRTRKTIHVLYPELPPLAKTCKTLYKEAPCIFYAENAFIWKLPAGAPAHFPADCSRELANIKKGFARRADLIRHFYFTVGHMVHFQRSVSRRTFEIRLHKSRDGMISCGYFSLGGFNPLGMHNRCRDQCCDCYLDEIPKSDQGREYNLLEVAEAFFDDLLYDTRYRTCDSCELPKNEQYSD